MQRSRPVYQIERELRTERKCPQDNLAAVAGLHRTYIGPVEREEYGIALASVEKITKTFKVSISETFGE